MHNTDILADKGYYTNETIYKNYNENTTHSSYPTKKTSNTTKRQTKTKNTKKKKTKKKDGFSIHNIIKDKENYYYICPENQILPVQQNYIPENTITE